jgi:hypothetical protein
MVEIKDQFGFYYFFKITTKIWNVKLTGEIKLSN